MNGSFASENRVQAGEVSNSCEMVMPFSPGAPELFSRPALFREMTRPKPARLCFGLLLLFIISLYALPSQLIPALAVAHPAQVLVLGALTLLVLEKMTLRQRFVLIWPEGYLLLAFVGAAAFSTFSAFWPFRAYEATLDMARIAIAYFLIVNTVVTEKRLRTVLAAMVFGGLFPALGALNLYVRGDLIEGRAHWIGIFGNSNELAYILVMLTPLAFMLARSARYPMRLLLWAALLLFVTVICLTFSRGSLVGLVGVAVALAIRQRGVLPKIAIGVLLAVGAPLVAAYWSRADGLQDIEQSYTFQQRIATIEAGVAMFAAHPLAGVGINCALVAFPLYAPQDFKFKGALVVHNTIVQALAETGLLGFVPFVLLIACGLYHARQLALSKGIHPAGRGIAVGLEVSLWGAMICGLSGGFLLSWFPYLVLGLIASARQIAGTPRL